MTFFLHLSDLHLVADGSETEAYGVYKEPTIRLQDRETRQRHLENTLASLSKGLTGKGDKLSAILMTGDIANFSGAKGFDKFPDILRTLEPCLAANYRVVVVPGNHDIIKETDAGSTERYEAFINATKGDRFVRPVLDGIDIDAAGQPKRDDHDPTAHYLLADDYSYVIIPINCADYYHSVNPLDPSIPTDRWDEFVSPIGIEKENEERYEKAVKDLRKRDLARVSRAQMVYWHDVLFNIRQSVKEYGRDETDLVVMMLVHHQLLPVSSVEEVKPGEAMINLGAFRQFLRSNRINVVFHGHKHSKAIYTDEITSLADQTDVHPHKVLVVSGGTIDSLHEKDENVALLVLLNESPSIDKPELLRLAPRLQIASIPCTPPGQTFNLQNLKYGQYPLYDLANNQSEPNTSCTFGNQNATRVYVRLVDYLRHSDHSSAFGITCQVYDTATIPLLKTALPNDPTLSAEKMNEWFEDIVDWWQSETHRQLPAQTDDAGHQFNHGERIYHYHGNIDQLQRAIDHLTEGTDTSKIVITLHDPVSDDISQARAMFPSFSLLQLLIRDHGGAKYLDCYAYFRKQEIRYWWPINLAEIYKLQSKVIKEIAHAVPLLVPGHITTFTAKAELHDTWPRVAVPSLDRAFDLRKPDLDLMALSIYLPVDDIETARSLWNRHLQGLVPPEKRDADGAPIGYLGLNYISDTLDSFDVHYTRPSSKTITDKVKELRTVMKGFANSTYNGLKSSNGKYESWQKSVKTLIEMLSSAVDEHLRSSLGADN